MQTKLVLILDNVRSGHNVGSLMRTSDGLGVHMIYLCGITPYPETVNDPRPSHVVHSNTKEIRKTALGAEEMISFEHHSDTGALLESLKQQGYDVYCLENNVPGTKNIAKATFRGKAALVLGSETEGLSNEILGIADQILEIPMKGHKNSLNVSVAGGIALFHLLNRG